MVMDCYCWFHWMFSEMPVVLFAGICVEVAIEIVRVKFAAEAGDHKNSPRCSSYCLCSFEHLVVLCIHGI